MEAKLFVVGIVAFLLNLIGSCEAYACYGYCGFSWYWYIIIVVVLICACSGAGGTYYRRRRLARANAMYSAAVITVDGTNHMGATNGGYVVPGGAMQPGGYPGYSPAPFNAYPQGGVIPPPAYMQQPQPMMAPPSYADASPQIEHK